MKKYLTFFLLLFGATVTADLAQSYEYPIRDLGNCRDRQECHLYCEVPAHKSACWSYSVYRTNGQVLGDETPKQKVSAFGINFPITELGSCQNLSLCKEYCHQPQNRTACQDYAKSHGLSKKEAVIGKAEAELGCTSKEDCSNFCKQESNLEVCKSFAKKYHLKFVYKPKMLQRAFAELGCDNRESCRQTCDKSENQVKCQIFAKRLNMGQTRREELVEKAKTELGCTSFDDCKRYCQDPQNSDTCRNFGQAVRQRVENKVKKPGDCATNEECRKICELTPEKCPGFPKKHLDYNKDRQTVENPRNMLKNRRQDNIEKNNLSEDESETETEVEPE